MDKLYELNLDLFAPVIPKVTKRRFIQIGFFSFVINM